jgi:hypothetical protein
MSNTFVHHGGAGFNSLGFDPNVDPDQSTFEFDFGSNARADSLTAALEQLPKLIRDDGKDQAVPITIGKLFEARCNETPLTMPLVTEAVVQLRDEFAEVEILTPDGKLRPTAVNLDWQDKVRTKQQRSFFRGNCGRDSTWSKAPIISTPLKPLHDRYARSLKYELPDRVLNLDEYSDCNYTVWASTPAIVWTAARPQEFGIHVHVHRGVSRIIDDTFCEVILHGEALQRDDLVKAMIARSII